MHFSEVDAKTLLILINEYVGCAVARLSEISIFIYPFPMTEKQRYYLVILPIKHMKRSDYNLILIGELDLFFKQTKK